MDTSAYKIQLSYPVSQNYTFEAEITSPAGNKMTVKAMDDEAYRKAKVEYEAEKQRLIKLFKKDLLEFLDITDHPKSEILFKMAWDREHHNGYNMVVQEAQDLLELLEL